MNNPREGVDLLKAMIRHFPGVLIGVQRQIGKTQAIMELVHEDHKGNAQIACMSQRMAELLRLRYRESFTSEYQPSFITTARQAIGTGRPLYADEWWAIPSENRRELMASTMLQCRIGTDVGLRDAGPEVIRFTEAELNYLNQVLANAAVSGNDTKAHFDIRRKVTSAIEGYRG